eukprot:IDg15731t1
MVVPILPIGVLLGKADTAFKLVGGSSIVFNALRSRIFGKVLRAIEYPDGELQTVKIYRMNVFRLTQRIAEAQPPIFPTCFLEPKDVKQISLYTSPHFTEPVTVNSHVSALPDNAWLFWSKESYEDDPIPTRGVKLDGSHIKKRELKPEIKDEELQDAAIKLARRIRRKQLINSWQHDRIVDFAIDGERGLLTIARNFKDESDFKYHALRLLERKDPLFSASDIEDTDESNSDAEDARQPNRTIEPQVELSSRE